MARTKFRARLRRQRRQKEAAEIRRLEQISRNMRYRKGEPAKPQTRSSTSRLWRKVPVIKTIRAIKANHYSSLKRRKINIDRVENAALEQQFRTELDRRKSAYAAEKFTDRKKPSDQQRSLSSSQTRNCKEKPDPKLARKGSGGSRDFVPWCERENWGNKKRRRR